MRTERGVGFRPPYHCSPLGPAPPVDVSLNIPTAELEWIVERGAGGGGRFGSQEG